MIKVYKDSFKDKNSGIDYIAKMFFRFGFAIVDGQSVFHEQNKK